MLFSSLFIYLFISFFSFGYLHDIQYRTLYLYVCDFVLLNVSETVSLNTYEYHMTTETFNRKLNQFRGLPSKLMIGKTVQSYRFHFCGFIISSSSSLSPAFALVFIFPFIQMKAFHWFVWICCNYIRFFLVYSVMKFCVFFLHIIRIFILVVILIYCSIRDSFVFVHDFYIHQNSFHSHPFS